MTAATLFGVFLASFSTGHWQANCYLIAANGSPDCVIIDPGEGAALGVRQLLAEHKLNPKGILATHGHFDHVADAATLADEYNIPLWIHSADRHLLSDPAAGLSPDSAALVKSLLTTAMVEPLRVEEFDDSSELDLARLTFSITPAPGHTAGSVLLGVDYTRRNPQVSRLVFSGDVVFAGSVGRTDLPGGNPTVMQQTLREVVLALPDKVALLPGHGPQTLMATERVSNPYLQATGRN